MREAAPRRAVPEASAPAAGKGPELARAAAARVADDARCRAELPGGGRLHLDRALPFLAAYRSPPGRTDAGAARLVDALAAYVVAPAEEAFRDDVDRVVAAVARSAQRRLGGLLLVELWTEAADEGDEAAAGEPEPVPPRVAVVVEGDPPAPVAAEALRAALEAARLCPENGGDLGVPRRFASVPLSRRDRAGAPGLPPLAADESCVRVGLEVSPFFRDPATGRPYPRVVEALRRVVARAVEEAAFAFAQEGATFDVPHAAALGRREIDRAVRHVDARLGEIYGAFDTLLQVTPVNADEAWARFRDDRCGREPSFRYRPVPFDPEETKRRLFHVPIEEVEDPLLAHLFREKQEELDREITLVRSVATDAFRWSSYQLHGTVDDGLLALAEGLLERLPPRGSSDDEEPSVGWVDADAFARRALRELEYYRDQVPEMEGGVEIRDDLASGLMVSKGVLLVSRGLRTPRRRVEALLHHEVGTHVVTYANGRLQPLRLFAAGLAGYEALQEGLAVLAEHLVGGLTRQRMRVLAGRVVAVKSVMDDAGFVDTWRLLAREHGFGARTAFVVALRVHRGGGFTKDAVYLRGLRDLLAWLSGGTSPDPLLVGKVGLAHADAVQELVLRGVLRLPALKPRYLTDPAARERLEACRGAGVLDLVPDLAA